MPLIEERVMAARNGSNPKVICRMSSGWAVIGDVQLLEGYCLLLPDPVVSSLNDLSGEDRISFLSDMALIGDALLQVTNARRINYEILGNSEPELHAHIFPRFAEEPEDKRKMPAWFYDWKNAPKFSIDQHGAIIDRLRLAIEEKMANKTVEATPLRSAPCLAFDVRRSIPVSREQKSSC